MTSSIPMFQVSQIGPNSFVFYNSVTDPLGFVEKLNSSIKLSDWKNEGVDDSQCLDVKLNHEKSNLYYKEVSFSDDEDGLSLYIKNSIKMAFWSTSDLYSKAYGLKNIKSSTAKIYKQMPSSIFDSSNLESKSFTAILFLNRSSSSSETVLVESEFTSQFTTSDGSVLIIPPGSSYKIGHDQDSDRYYCVYNFSSAII